VAASFVSFFAGFLLAALFFAIFLTSFFADAFCTSAGFLTIFTASVLAFYIAGLCAFGFLAAFGFRFGRFFALRGLRQRYREQGYGKQRNHE
jgi:hypothetical protein